MNNLLPNLFMFISISADNPYDKGKCKVPRGQTQTFYFGVAKM